MSRRLYVDASHAYAPFDNAVLQGLGATRSYVDIGHFRAPYQEFNYFQDNSLEGLGHSPVHSSYVKAIEMRGMGAIDPGELNAIDTQAPGSVKQFLLAGSPVSSLRSDVTLPFNQVHPYVYGAIAALALGTSYLSYKKWKKAQGGSSSSG